MFKDIFRQVMSLIVQPDKAWKTLAGREEENETFLSRFFYPLIGLVTLSAFVSILFVEKEFNTEMALKAAIRALVSVFGGFYLSAWLLNEIWNGIFKRNKEMKRWMRFVGYSSSPALVLVMVLALVPEFFFLKIFFLYPFYIVWEGAVPFMRVTEGERLKFSFLSTAVILLIPYLIWEVLFMLMPGFRM